MLDLGRTNVKDDCTPFLTNLNSLSLAYTDVTDDCIPYMNLQTLNLAHTNTTEQCIQHLANYQILHNVILDEFAKLKCKSQHDIESNYNLFNKS